MRARLHLDIAVDDPRDSIVVPKYVLYVVLGDRFERVCKPDTLWVDTFGGPSETLEPSYTLYASADGAEVLVEEKESSPQTFTHRFWWRQADGKYRSRKPDSDDVRALLARLGPPLETVVARDADIARFRGLPVWLRVNDLADDARIVARGDGPDVVVGDAKLLLPDAPPGCPIHADLTLMNEGALLRIFEGYSPEGARTLLLMRPQSKTFERVDRSEWPQLEASCERRSEGQYRIQIR